jgi:hypothetical protein
VATDVLAPYPHLFASVANRPKFLPQNANVAPEQSQQPNFMQNSKKWQKRAEPFEGCFHLKSKTI